MDSGFTNRPGDYLHSSRAASIASHISQVAATAHDHAMPAKHHFIGERLGKRPVQGNHHFGDAALCRPDTPFILARPNCLRSENCTLARSSISPSISEVVTASVLIASTVR